MKTWMAGFSALVLGVGIFTPNIGSAALLVTGTGTIEGKSVSAEVEARIVAGKLQLTLTNTGTRTDYTPAQVLTDINFNMDGVDFQVAGSSVFVATGSTLYYKGGATENGPFDVSPEWALAHDAWLADADGDSTIGPFDFSVTAAAFDAGVDALDIELFASGDLGGASGLNGADFGLVNDPANFTKPPLKNADYVVNSVVITLSAVGSLDLTDDDLSRISDVYFSYGSAHTGVERNIPEPSSFIVWSLVAALGISATWWRRRRSFCG